MPEDQPSSGSMLDRLKHFTSKATGKSDSNKHRDNDSGCRSKRTSAAHAGLRSLPCEEPLLQQAAQLSQNADVLAEDSCSGSADVPMTSAGVTVGAALRDQALSPSGSWSNDLLVTAV